MLSLRSVHKRFGSVVALDDVSLELRGGEVFALLGPNGAGKSTLVRLITGLMRPDRGVVDVGGAGTPFEPRARARIGLAPQDIALYENLTGAENLHFFATLHPALSRADITKRVDWALERTGLTGRSGDRVRTYSGGMKRRLNLAAALLHDPDLLVLDEPTAGVDPQARAGLLELVSTLRDEGKTILYTTHYLEEVERGCDRIAILDHGRILEVDTLPALLERHGGQSTLRGVVDGVVRSEPAADAQAALVALDRWRSEGQIERFRLDEPSLEQVFMTLTGRAWRD